MPTNSMWKIQGKDELISDERLISMIKNGEVSKEDSVTNKDMKIWMKLKDSIYQFYFTDKEDESDEDL